MKLKFPRLTPALALFLLAPVIGELLSGSAPPVEFFNPFGFALLVSLYGSGTLLIRELRIRWKKGIGSVLLLGAAYGMLEEGVMVASFFNPQWPDLGQLSVYGRWLGTNWTWALMLTMYHAVYSITIPILLVELAYPDQRETSWVSRRRFTLVALLLTGVVVFGVFIFTVVSGFTPPALPYLGTVVLVLLLGYAAYRLPAGWGRAAIPVPTPRKLWILGVVGTFAFFFGHWLMPTLIPWWPVGVLVVLALVVVAVSLLKRYAWDAATDRHRLALVSGALTFFIVFAPLQEFDATRTDNPMGMTLVGLACLIGLLVLRQRIWRRSTQRDAREPLHLREPAIRDSRIRGYCVQCGAPLSVIAAYCPQCGTPVASIKEWSGAVRVPDTSRISE